MARKITLVANSIYINKSGQVSAHYGPWNSMDDYMNWLTNEIGVTKPYQGTVIGILENGSIKEFWVPKADGQFEAKTSGGSDIAIDTDMPSDPSDDHVLSTKASAAKFATKLDKTEAEATYAKSADVDSALDEKLDKTEAESTYAKSADVTTELAKKLDATTAATTYAKKSDVDALSSEVDTKMSKDEALAQGFVDESKLDTELAKKINTASIVKSTETKTPDDVTIPSTASVKKSIDSSIEALHLHAVATSGSYNDLEDTPDIPDEVTIVDNCTSTSTTSALSANQGQVLMTAIQAMAGGIQFQGTVGVGGTKEWSSLPAASESNKGWEYKVITDHTESAPICHAGDYIISNGTSWTVDPAVNDSFELKSNKVTSLSAISSDAQYPSAKCVYDALDGKADESNLATVATTGKYTDLIGAPSVVNNLTSDSATDVLSAKQGKVLNASINTLSELVESKVDEDDLATVATSGKYSDLTGAPQVENVLTSTSSTNALSAKQGSVLKNSIDTLASTVESQSGSLDDITADIAGVKSSVTSLTTSVGKKLDKTEAASTYASKTEVETALADKLDATTAASTYETKANVTSKLATKLDITTAEATYAKSEDVTTELAKKLDATTAASTYATNTSVDSLATLVATKANDADLSAVAKSGSYSDLSDAPEVIDALTSDSATDALSAKQGKALKALIDANLATITALQTSLDDALARIAVLESYHALHYDKINLGYVQLNKVDGLWPVATIDQFVSKAQVSETAKEITDFQVTETANTILAVAPAEMNLIEFIKHAEIDLDIADQVIVRNAVYSGKNVKFYQYRFNGDLKGDGKWSIKLN